MTKKFTEEQYQKIIAIYSEQDFSADGRKHLQLLEFNDERLLATYEVE